jgi:ankyrin repeat protein
MTFMSQQPKEVIELLVNNGADVNAEIDGVPIIHFSIIINPSKEINKLLINNGANVNQKDDKGNSILQRLLLEIKEEKFSLDPLEFGEMEVSTNLQDLKSQLDISRKIIKNSKITLKDSGFDLNEIFDKVNEILNDMMFNMQNVQLNIQNMMLNMQSKITDSILNIDLKRAIKLSIEYGVDINHKNDSGQTALFMAIDMNDYSIVKLLIDNKVDINQKNEQEFIPLAISIVKQCSNKIIELLLNNSDYTNIDERNKRLILVSTITFNIPKKTTDLILNMSMDFIENNLNKLLLQSIIDYEELHKEHPNLRTMIDIATLLIEYGIDINHKNKNGETALSLAFEKKYYDLVEFLIKNGADVNITTPSNKRAPLKTHA